MDKYFRVIKREINALINLTKQRYYINSEDEQKVADNFQHLYYSSALFGKSWHDTYYFGILCQKCPMDMWIYQEIIHEVQPDIIIETGTLAGGSALYLAHLCELHNKGKVITVDINSNPKHPKHKRITYITGSSTESDIVKQVKKHIKKNHKVLVILDSDHSQDHVFQELQAYAPLVTQDSYLIVEDTNVNGHPVNPEHGPGPYEAVHDFLSTTTNFEIDKAREKYYLTFNPDGYLKKVK